MKLWVLVILQDQCKAYELQNQFLNEEILELSQLLQQDRKQAARSVNAGCFHS